MNKANEVRDRDLSGLRVGSAGRRDEDEMIWKRNEEQVDDSQVEQRTEIDLTEWQASLVDPQADWQISDGINEIILDDDDDMEGGDDDDDEPGTLLNIDYTAWYDSIPKAWKPAALAVLVVWYVTFLHKNMPNPYLPLNLTNHFLPLSVSASFHPVCAHRVCFLFATIGISASDFFCPNLATVADRLGLNESTAGVTFLAFG